MPLEQALLTTMIHLLIFLKKYIIASLAVSLICCLSFTPCFGQSTIKDTITSVLPNRYYLLASSGAESIAIKCTSCSFDKAFFLIRGDTLKVQRDPHADQTAFVLLTDTSSMVTFYSGTIEDTLHFYFIKTSTLTRQSRANTRIYTDDCQVEVVAPQEWRQGLPSPSATPASTQTRHIVIHHSATTNVIPDPYLAVRSIYTYHTQVNGWDDIGYNYLIAPDGTIFQGRDAKGLFDADYALGAHMCGVNAATMGICMLGTYSTTLPTRQALESLYKLIKWKSEKDGISLTDSSFHAIGPPSSSVGSQLLPHLCGHRDGCKEGYTECPGETLYQHINSIRQQITQYSCAPLAVESQSAVYPNPASSQIKTNFSWQYLRVYDMQGKLLRTYINRQSEFISLKGLNRGMYLFYFYTSIDQFLIHKVIVL